MNALFQDHENLSSALNGRSLGPADAVELFRSLQDREPFLCSLETPEGTLLIGVSREVGCVQYTPPGGGPPFLMAVDGTARDSSDVYVEFLSGGTPSPIHARYCPPWSLVERIVLTFLERGVRAADVVWEGI